MNDWIPIDSGLLPSDFEIVQVTYLGYADDVPHCDAFAYMSNGKWYWSDTESLVAVKITAWKTNCMPYGVMSINKEEETV